jgi:RHS repeat-associated protein
MPGRSVNFKGYRYGFNGKEKDQAGEFGSLTNYDYGFRIYNPGIGRFLSVDPLAPDYPWYTPYQFAGNMPLWAVDLDGLEPRISTVGEFVEGKGYTFGSDNVPLTVGYHLQNTPLPDPNKVVVSDPGTIRLKEPNFAGRLKNSLDNTLEDNPLGAGIGLFAYNIVDGAYVLGTKTLSDMKLMSGARHLNYDGVTPEGLYLSGVGTYSLLMMGAGSMADDLADDAVRQVKPAGNTSQVQLNRNAGNAFRDEIAGALEAEGRQVATEIYKKTPFGPRIIDIEVSNGGRVLGGIETKVGSSRYNPLQRIKDIWLDTNTPGGYPVQEVRRPPLKLN